MHQSRPPQTKAERHLDGFHESYTNLLFKASLLPCDSRGHGFNMHVQSDYKRASYSNPT